MTQDRTPQRTADADGWSPFGGTVRPDADGTADRRPSTVRLEAPSWRPRVIEGGRGHTDGSDATVDEDTDPVPDVPTEADTDVLDAAAADALAVLDVPAPAPEDVEDAPAPVAEPAPQPVEETPTAAVESPAAAPEAAPQAPPEPAPEPDSTPHTPQPEHTHPEDAAPAQEATEAAETPHSTTRWRQALWSLNPGGVFFQPQASIAEVINAARNTMTDRTGLDRATEIAWVYGIAVPVSVAAYTIAASVKRKWRGIGTWTVAALWIIAVHSAPVDTATVWWWTLVGYWVSTVFILPAVIQTRK